MKLQQIKRYARRIRNARKRIPDMDFNWAFQQAMPEGKPAGDIEKYNTEALSILRACGFTSWRSARCFYHQRAKITDILFKPYALGIINHNQFKSISRAYSLGGH